MKFKSRGDNKTENKMENIPVAVSGFAEPRTEGGDWGVKGNRVDTGEEVTVYLTDRGKAASQNRASVEKLKDGFKFGRDKYQLEPGGIVSFRSAWKMGDVFIGSWPNVVAFNAEDAKAYSAFENNTMLRMFEKKLEDGSVRHSGAVYLFDENTDNHVTGKPQHYREIADIAVETAMRGGNVENPAFLVRLVDSETKELKDCSLFAKQYNSEEKREMNPAERKQALAETIHRMLQDNPDANINVMPAELKTISPVSLKGDDQKKSQFGAYKAIENVAYVRGEEHVAKPAIMKLGGDNNEFINGIWPVDVSGPGVLPELIGDVAAPGKSQQVEVKESSDDEVEQNQQEEQEPHQSAPLPHEMPEEAMAEEDPFDDLGLDQENTASPGM